MTTPAPSGHDLACTCDWCQRLDAAAQIYVDGLAERDSLSPHDAAVAAGARTPEAIEALAGRIAADRQPARSTA